MKLLNKLSITFCVTETEDARGIILKVKYVVRLIQFFFFFFYLQERTKIFLIFMHINDLFEIFTSRME